MMKVLITGMSGTVGRALAEHLRAQGHEVHGWNRQHIAIDSYPVMEAYLRGLQPDVVYHLAIASSSTGKENESWLVNYTWSSELAWICRILNIQFIFASTALVFSSQQQGPYTLDSIPDASEGYGFEKRMAENQVRLQNAQAKVVRLGWQIGDAPGSNNLIDYIAREMKSNGMVRASRLWYPACSFLADTVQILQRLIEMPAGLYMADSNERWNLPQIIHALAQRCNADWFVQETQDYQHDQRLVDGRLGMASLKERLPMLP